MKNLLLALAPVQIASIIALAVLFSLIMVIFLVCFIRTLRIKPKVVSVLDSLDSNFRTDGQLYAQHLSAMIQLATISSSEETAHSAEFVKLLFSLYPRLAKACDFRDFNGGIMLTWPGKNHENPLVLMSHYDVAPILSGQWEHSPFSGDILDGIVHGRGAVDTKGNLCAILEACESLLSDNFVPSRDIIIFSSSKEEVAGDDAPLAAEYLKSHSITPMLVLDEGGAMLNNPLNGVRGNFAMIAMCERSRATVTLQSDSKESIDKLCQKAMKYKFSKPSFAPEVLAMFQELTPYMAFPMKFIFANLWLFKDLLLGLLPKLSKEAKAMICSTYGFSPIIEDGGKFTAVGSLACTYYTDIDNCQSKSIALANKCGVTATPKSVMHTCKPEPINSSGYKLVAETIRTTFDNVIPSPFILFGGTDSRHFAEVSDSVIRFAPLHLTHQEFNSVHNTNEQIHIDSIEGAVCFFRELIKKTCP